MPFRVWLYLNAMGLLSLLTVILLVATGVESVINACLWIIVPLGLASALLAIGRIWMTCPFCKRYGTFGADKTLGPFLNCPTCGLVHGTGPLWLRLTRDSEIASEDDVAESDLTHLQ